MPTEWFDPNDDVLDADWDEHTDWAGFGTFDVPADRYTQPNRELGIYDYDEGAQQLPWDFEPEDEQTALRHARARAITSLLNITSIEQRNKALRFLTELFEHLPHPSTYRALQKLAGHYSSDIGARS